MSTPNRQKNKGQGQQSKAAPPKRSKKTRGMNFDEDREPAVYGETIRTTKPTINQRNGAYRVSNTELVVATVNGSTLFSIPFNANINPGLATLFPWLSKIAANYEQYNFERLEFRWVPIAPTSTKGNVILSPNYDASDPVAVSEVQLVNSYGTIDFPCWKPSVLKMDRTAMHALGPRKFIRTFAVAGDPKTFDVGIIYLGTNNEVDASAIGKLFVSYDVNLYIPSNDHPVFLAPSQTSFFTTKADQTVLTTVTTNLNQWIVYAGNARADPLGFAGNAALQTPNTPWTNFLPGQGVYLIYGSLRLTDSANEAGTYQVSIADNGAIFTGNQYTTTMAANGSATFLNMSFTGQVVVSVGDLITIQVQITGAAGTLKVLAGSTIFASLA